MEVSGNELAPYLKQVKEKYDKSIDVQRRTDYADARERYSVEDKTILYTAFHGRGLCCNPYALFLYIKGQERFKDFTHVWVLDEMKEHSAELEEYKKDNHVIFVEFHSKEYFRYLASAKYLINNVTEQSYFVKKPEQVVINTWHGIPLKHLGYDVPNGALTIDNTIRNFLFTDYLISPNEFTTWNFREGYKLHDVFPGKIIEAGYPRCDVMFYTKKEQFIAKAKAYGVEIDPGKKIILFAPTWKGDNYITPDLDMQKEEQFIENLYKYIDRDKYQVLFKPHQIVYKVLRDKGLLKPTYVPATIDANEILAVSDVLISDYSSIFFDFLVTGRPILFYVPDLETYKKSRGLYFSVEELPGPVTMDGEQIGKWLKELDADSDSYKRLFDYNNYVNAVQRFIPNEDGHACERIVNAIFEGSTDHQIDLSTQKRKLLFHIDTMKSNGITSSLLNLLNYLDYDQYDVTLNAIVPNRSEDVISDINKNVRVLCRCGATVATLEEQALVKYCHENLIIERDHKDYFPAQVYEREFHRCFGDVPYDDIINFAGYSGYWTNVFHSQKNARHYIWIHNDLKSELEHRVINGVPIFQYNLPQMFKHYHDADKLVGCSESTMRINREKIGEESTYAKFTFMHNMLDYHKVLDNLDNGKVEVIDGRPYLLAEEGWYNDVDYEEFVYTPLPDPACINFITVGRLSPEKNHANLIKAFARLVSENPKVRLFILGDGPLRMDLREQINRLELQGKVYLIGNVKNPFYYEKRCQCFILPSFHEGMPMVLLEARTVGMPIIVSDFSTVSDSLRENGQLLIQTDKDSIYEGMKAFLEGKVPNEFQFDPESYNKECMQEFEKILKI